jgi:hypothetical protein
MTWVCWFASPTTCGPVAPFFWMPKRSASKSRETTPPSVERAETVTL